MQRERRSLGTKARRLIIFLRATIGSSACLASQSVREGEDVPPGTTVDLVRARLRTLRFGFADRIRILTRMTCASACRYNFLLCSQCPSRGSTSPTLSSAQACWGEATPRRGQAAGHFDRFLVACGPAAAPDVDPPQVSEGTESRRRLPPKAMDARRTDAPPPRRW